MSSHAPECVQEARKEGNEERLAVGQVEKQHHHVGLGKGDVKDHDTHAVAKTCVSYLASQIEQRGIEVLEWAVRVAHVAEAGDHELANVLRRVVRRAPVAASIATP